MDQVFALPTPAAVMAMQHLGGVVAEIGAGRGVWTATLRAYGVPAVGYDLEPHPDAPIHVLKGDHRKAAKGDFDTMLAVWPPDGPEIQRWINAKAWANLVIVANHDRLVYGDSRDDYTLLNTLPLPPGDKGSSVMEVYARTDTLDWGDAP